jgi:DNA-binding transcriptional ArsR family regulator
MHAFDILGDPVRRRILELLAGGAHASGDIVAVIGREFGITQPAVFASVRAEGARRIYAIDAAPLREVDAWLERFRVFWEHRLEALATEIARGKKQRDT